MKPPFYYLMGFRQIERRSATGRFREQLSWPIVLLWNEICSTAALDPDWRAPASGLVSSEKPGHEADRTNALLRSFMGRTMLGLKSLRESIVAAARACSMTSFSLNEGRFILVGLGRTRIRHHHLIVLVAVFVPWRKCCIRQPKAVKSN
jgi:hypothetical protein